MRDLQLLLNYGQEVAKVKDMISLAKREFVMSHHPRDIFHLPPSGSWKYGCYKTYVYVDSKRKELTASTKEKLIEKLYDFYYEQENRARTLEQVFEMQMDYDDARGVEGFVLHLSLSGATLLVQHRGVEDAQALQLHGYALSHQFGYALRQLHQHGLDGVASHHAVVVLQVLGQSARRERFLTVHLCVILATG